MMKYTSAVSEKNADYFLLTLKSFSTAQKTMNKDEDWKILIVDDEKDIHTLTRVIFQDFTFEERGVTFLSAYSAQEAKELMIQYPDMAVILLDVVMEEDDSGLKFVDFLRKDLKNKLTRIILRTGQPGSAPEKQVVLKYDINDYKEKTELTAEKFFSTIVMALRAFRDLKEVENK